MGKVIRRVNARTPVANQSDRISVDRIFNLMAQASQVLLLLLGIFGYFYTVLPIYQKSLLDEEIAQKTIELRAKEKQTTELAAKIADQTRQISKTEVLLRSAKSEASETYRSLQVQIFGSLSNRFVSCSYVSVDKELKGDELKNCPQQVMLGNSHLIEKLKPPDRKLVSALLTKIAGDAEPEFQKIVEIQKNRLEANLSQQELITRELAQKETEKGNNEGKYKVLGPLTLELKQYELKSQVDRIKGDSFRAFQLLLSKASSRLVESLLNGSS